MMAGNNLVDSKSPVMEEERCSLISLHNELIIEIIIRCKGFERRLLWCANRELHQLRVAMMKRLCLTAEVPFEPDLIKCIYLVTMKEEPKNLRLCSKYIEREDSKYRDKSVCYKYSFSEIKNVIVLGTDEKFASICDDLTELRSYGSGAWTVLIGHTDTGWTVIHYIAALGRSAMFRKLCEFDIILVKSLLKKIEADGQTAQELAQWNKRYEIVKLVEDLM